MVNQRFEQMNEEVITSGEIRQILERYRIGKKPLAKLLGWGETTIIRYMEGDVPTNEYSIKLKALLDNPEYYYDLLMNRKDCLTNVAYKKSKGAALSCIMKSKIYAVAYHIINKCDGDICPGYLQYLLYYIQTFSIALYDKEMFKEDYSINNEQMPYLKLYETMKRCGIHTLETGEEFLSDQDIRLIEAVYESFSWYGPKALKELMKLEISKLKISRDRYNNRVISKEAIMLYFKDICERYGIGGLDEISKYPDQRVLEIRNMSI